MERPLTSQFYFHATLFPVLQCSKVDRRWTIQSFFCPIHFLLEKSLKTLNPDLPNVLLSTIFGSNASLINQDFQAKETIGICNWRLAEN